jgi:hypothetical protein
VDPCCAAAAPNELANANPTPNPTSPFITTSYLHPRSKAAVHPDDCIEIIDDRRASIHAK